MKSTNIYVIHGYTSSSEEEWFPKEIDAKLIILSSGKHFIARDGYTDFPVLLDEIQKLISE